MSQSWTQLVVLCLVAIGAMCSAAAKEPPVLCYNTARQLGLSESLGVQLCGGIDSSEPAVCYREARARTTLSQEQSVSLCECASSLAPLLCYTDARSSTTLSVQEALELCSNAGKTAFPSWVCQLRDQWAG